MERVEARDDEDASSYQRRRDAARANYFMVERSHDDDDRSFREKLDKAAEAFRSRRHAWSDSAAQAGKSVVGGSRVAAGSVANKGQQLYSSNPLIGGLVAAAAGAFLGSLLPESEAEQHAFGGIGEKARNVTSDQADHLMSAAREKKDDLVAAAEEHVAPSGSGEQPSDATGNQAAPTF